MITKSYSVCTYSYCGNEAEKNRTDGYASGVLYNRAEGREITGYRLVTNELFIDLLLPTLEVAWRIAYQN